MLIIIDIETISAFYIFEKHIKHAFVERLSYCAKILKGNLIQLCFYGIMFLSINNIAFENVVQNTFDDLKL